MAGDRELIIYLSINTIYLKHKRSHERVEIFLNNVYITEKKVHADVHELYEFTRILQRPVQREY